MFNSAIYCCSRFAAIVLCGIIAFTSGCSVGLLSQGASEYVRFDDGLAFRFAHNADGPIYMYLPKDVRNQDSVFLQDERYVICADRVFLKGIELPDVDTATFHLMRYPYSKDANTVFFGSVPIPEANPSTFEVISESSGDSWSPQKEPFESIFGKLPFPDYFGPVILGNGGYGRDSQHVFYGPMKALGVDAESFQAFEAHKGKDKDGLVRAGTHNYDGKVRTPESAIQTARDRVKRGLPEFPPVAEEIEERIRD